MTHAVSYPDRTDSPLLHVEDRAGVAVLRIDNGKVNALDLELLVRIAGAMDEVADATAVVLTGTGSSFSAGVDLRRIVAGDAEHTDTFLTALSRALVAVFRHPRPVVAAVNGHAIAGGCVLAAAADVRLMSGGSLGLTELRVGVPFPTAAIEIVRYAVGSAAPSLAMFAELHDPQRAHQMGLVHGVCAPEVLVDEAIVWARRLAAVTPETFALTKRQLHAPAEARIAERTERDDADVRRLWKSADGRAAISAFLDGLARTDDRRS
ncbi:MAG: enoyl-CoA hydratase/isomerase family protein [Geodermatophilaceae bacterium]